MTVKSDPLELEIPFCVVAVLPWKDIVSLMVIAVVKAMYSAIIEKKTRIARETTLR